MKTKNLCLVVLISLLGSLFAGCYKGAKAKVSEQGKTILKSNQVPQGAGFFAAQKATKGGGIDDETCTKWLKRRVPAVVLTAILGVAAGSGGVATVFPPEQEDRARRGFISLGVGMASAGVSAYDGVIINMFDTFCTMEDDSQNGTGMATPSEETSTETETTTAADLAIQPNNLIK
jgi:hypothetical protein